MKKIRLRGGGALETKRKEMKLNKGRFAARLGLTAPTLYRACLDPADPAYTKPGERLIAAILTTFPEAKFEDYFFFE